MGYKSKFKGEEIDARLEKMVNVTYAELKALRDEGKLIAGQMYRMTDYETTCTWENTQVAGHPFDLVLTALDNKTLDEKCSAIWSERDKDGYFANSNLPAWDVRYCLDNDKDRFGWAQLGGSTFKFILNNMEFTCDYMGQEQEISGVVYHMWIAQVNGKPAGFVFTETLSPQIGDTVYLSMTGSSLDAPAEVVSVVEQEGGKGVIYRLNDESDNSVPYDFKNIMFSRPLTDGEYDAESGVDTFCYTFCCIDSDTLKIEDQSVKEPSYCHNNKFSAFNYNNVFLTFSKSICISNTFGNNCYFNTFGNNCHFNTFGNYCYSNMFGSGSYSNTFGDYCNYNTFGDNCNSNTFGNQCNSNTFEDCCNSNTFGDYCISNTFISSGAASDVNAMQNYHISCVRSAEIQVYRGRNYDTYITYDKSRNIVEYTVDDIINK